MALIALLLALHMTVAAGTLNGLILYANIVNVHRDIFFPPGQPGFRINPLSVFISWLNLDFGIPTCFYDGLDALISVFLASIRLSSVPMVYNRSHHPEQQALQMGGEAVRIQPCCSVSHTHSHVIYQAFGPSIGVLRFSKVYTV